MKHLVIIERQLDMSEAAVRRRQAAHARRIERCRAECAHADTTVDSWVIRRMGASHYEIGNGPVWRHAPFAIGCNVWGWWMSFRASSGLLIIESTAMPDATSAAKDLRVRLETRARNYHARHWLARLLDIDRRANRANAAECLEAAALLGEWLEVNP
jgi:hypothetical protein